MTRVGADVGWEEEVGAFGSLRLPREGFTSHLPGRTTEFFPAA